MVAVWVKRGLAGVVIAPVCAYIGLYAREFQLSQSMDKNDNGNLALDRANKARVVELAKERQHLLREREQVDHKILLAERRLAIENGEAC